MGFSKRQNLLFIFLIILHLLLVLLMQTGVLRNFFYDSSELRKGQACDFFAIYQAGDNILCDKSLYLDTEGQSTPYSYPFRYLPFSGYILGVFFNNFEPFTAYFIWIVFLEFILTIDIYLTLRLVKKSKNYLLSIIPWLIFSPYFLELYVGQWTFFLASLLFFTIYGLLKSKDIIYTFILAPLIKPNALIITPILIKQRKWRLLIYSSIAILISSFLYFYFFKDDMSVFLENFENEMYSYGGNFGFKSLFYIIYSRYLGLPFARSLFSLFVLTLGLYTLWLTFKSKDLIAQFTLWICFYFFIYTDVWEHHFVLMMPVFALIFTKLDLSKNLFNSKEILWIIISFLLVSLPSPFIFHFFFVSNPPIEIDYLNPFYVIIYHMIKIIGVGILYFWALNRIKRSLKESSLPCTF
jgi:hypothetical protein